MELYNAAKDGNLDQCKKLLRRRQNLINIDYGFAGAAEGGQKEIIEYLISRDHNPHKKIYKLLLTAVSCADLKMVKKHMSDLNDFTNGFIEIIHKYASVLATHLGKLKNILEIANYTSQYISSSINHPQKIKNIFDEIVSDIACQNFKRAKEKIQNTKITNIIIQMRISRVAGKVGNTDFIQFLKHNKILHYPDLLHGIIEGNHLHAIKYIYEVSNVKFCHIDNIFNEVRKLRYNFVRQTFLPNFEIVKFLVECGANGCYVEGEYKKNCCDKLKTIECIQLLNMGIDACHIPNYRFFRERRERRLNIIKLSLNFMHNDVVDIIGSFIEF